MKCSNQNTQSSWMDKKIWPAYRLSTTDPPQNKQPTQTESEGLEKILHANGQAKKKKWWGSNTYIWLNRLQNKVHKKRPRRTLHNIQGKSPSRRHKHYKHICTQHRSTRMYKQNLGGLQERYRHQHTYTRGF